MSSNFLKSYVRGEASYGFWNLISRGVGVVNTFIVISAITLYEYGSFQLLLASYAGIAVLLHIGTGVIRNDILRFEAENRKEDAKKLFRELLNLRIITGAVLWATVFFGAPLLSFQYGPDFILLIRIMSFMFIYDALMGSLTTIVEMRQKFNAVASRAAIAKISQLVILLTAVLFYRIDLRLVVISLVISMFVSLTLLLRPFFDSYLPWRSVKKSNNKFLFKILGSYGKWEVGEPLINRFTAFFETWAIKLFISTEAVAIFSIAQMIIATLTGLSPVKTLLTLIPMEASNEDKLRKIYARGVKYLIIFTIAVGSMSFFLAPFIISAFFAKYVVSLPYFKVLLLTLPLHAILGVSSVFLISLRRQKFLFSQKVLKSFVSIPLYLLLLPAFGLWGLVAQNYIWLVISLTSVIIYLKHTKPQLLIKWLDALKFNKEDVIFARNVSMDIKNYFLKRLFSQ